MHTWDGLAHTLLLLPARVPRALPPPRGCDAPLCTRGASAAHQQSLHGVNAHAPPSSLLLRACSAESLAFPAEVGTPSSALKARVCSFRFSQMK